MFEIAMSDNNGAEVFNEMKARTFAVSVLMLSTHAEAFYESTSMTAGVVSYLTEEQASEHLMVTIRKICSGERPAQ